MYLKKTVLILFASLLLISCIKNLEAQETFCDSNQPLKELLWLNNIKTGFEQSTDASKKQIIQYTYKNETVFMINPCFNCPDNLITVYSCSGEKICEFGGIAGLNTCPDFYEQATNKIILWEN